MYYAQIFGQRWLDFGQILVKFSGEIGQIVSQILENFKSDSINIYSDLSDTKNIEAYYYLHWYINKNL